MRLFRFRPVFAIALAALALTLMLAAHPARAFTAAVRGIAIWWDVLFPALFPFFVISELLLGFGIVHFFGTLLDPLMRPIFRVPGIGGFVMTMGLASGYPVGARLTAQLWEQRLVTREEGERLVAFTTSSDPIFLIGAVSVGLFQDASLAVILAVAHYGSSILLGLLMRFHGQGAEASGSAPRGTGPILLESFHAMHKARIRDGRPFGIMLNQSIRSAIQMIFIIGGLVVFFSAVLEMLTVGGIMDVFYDTVSIVLHGAGIPIALSKAIANGFFEVTLGAKAAGEAAGSIPLQYKTAVGAFVLSWGGLSVHAQIMSLLHQTNLRYSPFVIARVIHAFLSAGAVLLLWEPLQPLRTKALLSMAVFLGNTGPSDLMWRWSMPASVIIVAGMTGILLVLAILSRIYISMKRY